MKKLSIITVSYNNLAGLRQTCNSISAQTFGDFEWIVVDGGSTDGSKDFLCEHQKDMAWWCSEQDGGIYNAMNKGIAHAQGEYILFLNSGDTLFAPDTLKDVFCKAKTPEADIIYGDWTEAHPRRPGKLCHSPEKVNFYSFASRPLCHQTAFVRTKLLKQSPYDESYRICSDWAKWLELSRQGCTFEHISVTICHFVLGGFSYRSVKERRREQERLLREFYPAELSEVLIMLTGKVARRLTVIRKLVWLSSILLFVAIALAVWVIILYR